MKNPTVSDLAISRLNVLKASYKDPKSNKSVSEDYLKGVEDSLWMIQDLFKSLKIPFNS